MLCSFQKPEPWQPSRQWPMPKVPAPEDCELDETKYARAIRDKQVHPELAALYQALVVVRSTPSGQRGRGWLFMEYRSGLVVLSLSSLRRSISSHQTVLSPICIGWRRGRYQHMSPLSKKWVIFICFNGFLTILQCILAYFSDHYLYVFFFTLISKTLVWISWIRILTAARIMGLRRGGKGKDALTMTVRVLDRQTEACLWPVFAQSTLDHTIWFYKQVYVITAFQCLIITFAAMTLTLVTGCYMW